MKAKRLAGAAVSLLLTFLLCGCELFTADTAELLRPPALSGDLAPISDAIKESAGGAFTLKYPSAGNFRSAVIQNDIDGDGLFEAFAFYSTQAIMKNPQGLCDSLQQTFYRYPALTPINRNIEGDEPACPQNVRIVGNRDEALLLWNMENEEGGCAVAYYVVYAFEGDNIGDLNNPANIICKTTARGVNLSNIPSLKNGSHTLVVTAVNKFKRESCPSEFVHY